MLNRTVFLFFLVLFFTGFVHAEKIVFPVNEEDTGYDDPVDIAIDWDEKWFGKKPSTEYNHDIARIACLLSEVSYVNLAVDPELNQLKNVYKKLGVKDGDMQFYYDMDYSAAGLGKNQAAFSFATKEIQSATGKATLVFVVIRGTPHQASEWISNINVSDSEQKESKVHEGFFVAKTEILKKLILFLLGNKISPENSYFIVTGHSRGAAITNMLCVDLADAGFFPTNKIYAYTFASPNVSAEDRVNDEKYNFIWNIINPEDIVPTVPLNRNKWKYQKFGQTKVFANYWNTDCGVFNNEYIPKVNQVFRQLLRRNYCPFKTDTFIPSLVTRLITDIYPTVKDYYGSAFSLRRVAEKIFNKLFPDEETELTNEREKNSKSFSTSVIDYINKKTDGFIYYSENAFFDMHVCSSYFSWMIALSEEEAFNDTKSSRLVIKGAYECAILDKNNNVVARIFDGIPEIKSLKIPVIAVPYPSGTIIGFPSVGEYTVIIYKDSILPTPIPIRIEHYDAQGYETYISPKQKVFTHTFSAYYFTVGEKTVEQKKIGFQKATPHSIRKIIDFAGLKQEQKFRIQPEIIFDSDLKFEGGIRLGSRKIHGTVLSSQSVTKFGKNLEASLGFGCEKNLIGQVLLGLDAYGSFIYLFEKKDNKVDDEYTFNFVPEARVSLGIKPFHRATMFVSGVFDFHIDGFNNGAFSTDGRENFFGSFYISDNVEIYPSVRFGIRF